MEELEYSHDIIERHLKWITADEGKLFWKWLELQMKQSVEGSERFLGAHDIEDIIAANKMKATQQALGWVSQFGDRLKEMLAEDKKDGKDLTSIEYV